MVKIDHPAKFSTGMMGLFLEILLRWVPQNGLVLDPFCGVGTVHLLRPTYWTVGVEIEPEWAATSRWTRLGDATNLPDLWNEFFHAVVTSPTYGNRMADHHNDVNVCRACKGHGGGMVRLGDDTWEFDTCSKCHGTGVRKWKRRTYRHVLGRELHHRNTGQLQWGEKYRQMHELAWNEAWRVLRPGGVLVLNCSDHIRNHKVQEVTAWHVETLRDIGFELIEAHAIRTKRMKYGVNADVRVPFEYVLAFRKPQPDSTGES